MSNFCHERVASGPEFLERWQACLFAEYGYSAVSQSVFPTVALLPDMKALKAVHLNNVVANIAESNITSAIRRELTQRTIHGLVRADAVHCFFCYCHEKDCSSKTLSTPFGAPNLVLAKLPVVHDSVLSKTNLVPNLFENQQGTRASLRFRLRKI